MLGNTCKSNCLGSMTQPTLYLFTDPRPALLHGQGEACNGKYKDLGKHHMGQAYDLGRIRHHTTAQYKVQKAVLVSPVR